MDERAIIVRALPSTEKCFSDESIYSKKEVPFFSMLKNQRLAFQVAYAKKTTDIDAETPAELVVTSEIKQHIKMYSIEEVPVYKPTYPNADDGYLRKEPGMFPDLLMPCSQWHRVFYHRLRSFLIIIEDRNGIPAGNYKVCFEFFKDGERLGGTEVTVNIIDALLPEQKLIYTNWFHSDCLASYYNCEIFGKRHWQIIENYVREAVSEGINMILTPVLTPPLDTGRGWYRPAVQLVDIKKDGDKYTFAYSKLDKWMALCEKCGIKYFEISHLFSQWSASKAPQVIATENGERKRIFGWDTDSHSEEYVCFIRTFLKHLIAHLKKTGRDKKCFFHISDEPTSAVYDSYVLAKNSVSDILEGYPVVDALSEFEFYKTGAIKMPIPSTTDAYPFLEQELPMRWTYYCCGQWNEVSNRFVAMPGERTEILGVQLYKYRIDGFLQWGFNFYYSASSWHLINPFIDLSGDNWVPAGDTFAVYPAPDGTPYRSLHGMQLSDAFEDMRLLQLCESMYGREYTEKLINENSGGEITFHKYPHSAEYLLNLKAKLYKAIEANI